METRQAISTPAHDIKRRDIHFDLDKVDMNDWHKEGFHVSHFFNVQSLLFPKGERFFIHSVRYYRDEITDPHLQRQIGGFIGQEAMHSREHEVYNVRLEAIGYNVQKMDRLLSRVFSFAERYLSPKTCLAMTTGFEHLTATCAEELLGHEEVLDGSDPDMVRLWRWHALEEAEHKSVAFDVYQQVEGGFMGWLRRSVALLLTGLGMQVTIAIGLIWVSAHSGRLFDFKGWGRLIRFLWLKPGVFRRGIPRFFGYFKPGFHPWQIDNSEQLQRWQQEFSDRRQQAS